MPDGRCGAASMAFFAGENFDHSAFLPDHDLLSSLAMCLKRLGDPKPNATIDSFRKVDFGFWFHSANCLILPQIFASCNRIFPPASDCATNPGCRPELSRRLVAIASI